MPYTLYTNEEYDMHFIYGFCNRNATSAVAEYQRWFPGQILPNKQTFMAVHRHLQGTGTFHSTFSSDCTHREDEENIVAMVERCLHQSTSRISSQPGIPLMSVWQALSFELLYPHPHSTYRTMGLDVRLQFYRWIDAHPELCPLILFTHEAQFTCDGENNVHNTHS
jgi:hypothetical protein